MLVSLLAPGCTKGKNQQDDPGDTGQQTFCLSCDVGVDATNPDAGTDATDGTMKTLSLSVTGATSAKSAGMLPALGDSHQWEGWLVDTSGSEPAPYSTGKFGAPDSKDSDFYSWQVPASKVERADKFVLTIEPKPDGDPAPSTTKFLGGPIDGSEAKLTTAPIGNFSDASGSFILNAPSAETDKPKHGIWFLIPPNEEGPSASFQALPKLDFKGWAYEGWVVDTSGQSPQPYTTGKFADKPQSWTDQDRDGAGPSSGPGDTPAYPGQDFLGGEPGGNDFDLTSGGNWKVVLTVEPEVGDVGDTSPKPFPSLKPMSATIGESTEGKTSQDLNLNTDSLP
ncbi:MAG: anti-sigma factor, partial [Bradymonadaceae bacterium]